MDSPDAIGNRAWNDALLAVQILAVAPLLLGGARLRVWHTSARSSWLQALHGLLEPDTVSVEIQAQVAHEQLVGGLDIVNTLQTGSRQRSSGLLARAHNGVLIVRGAERLDNTQLSAVNEALDEGQVRLERDGLSCLWPARFGCIALDEGVVGEEGVAAALADRLAFDLDLHAVGLADLRAQPVNLKRLAVRVQNARQSLATINTPPTLVPALCQSAWNLNIRSLRAPLLALQVARVVAALEDADTVLQEHAEVAVRLVYGPRAIAAPDAAQATGEPDSDAQAPSPGDSPSTAPENSRPDNADSDRGQSIEPAATAATQTGADNSADADAEADAATDQLAEVLVSAVQAALPGALLQRAVFSKVQQDVASGAGRFGPIRQGATRGVPLASRPGKLAGSARLDLVATLRKAIPWQRLRQPDGKPRSRPIIRAEDFCVKRFQQRAPTVTLFIVDASGSAAMQRLAEAKGAVEELLLECYVRRDEVGLIAFRGTGADLLLPPTRSLVRAKRALAQLVGGGGTPLAAGLQEALVQAQRVRRRGAIPLLVVLTDGGANVDLSGVGNRAVAKTQVKTLARAIGAAGEAMILVDTSARGQSLVREIAQLSAALYVPLPFMQQGALVDQVLAFGASTSRAPARA